MMHVCWKCPLSAQKWCTINSVLQRAYSLGNSAYGYYLRKYVILCTSIHSLFYNLSLFSVFVFLMKAVGLQQFGTATILTLQTGNFHRFKASTFLERSERQISGDTTYVFRL